MSEQERRWKLIYVDEQVMMDVITGMASHHHDCVSLPVFSDSPSGYSVVSVNYDFGRRAFAVCIFHETYPVLAPGGLLEVVSPRIEMRTFDMDMIQAWAKEHPNE